MDAWVTQGVIVENEAQKSGLRQKYYILFQEVGT